MNKFDKTDRWVKDIVGDEFVSMPYYDKWPIWKISHHVPNSLVLFLFFRGRLRRYAQGRRTLLLNILRKHEELYLAYGEDPNEYGLSDKWIKISDWTWIIPDSIKIIELEEYLKCGDWFIYHSSKAISFNLLDASNPIVNMEVIKEHSIDFMLQSGMDNKEWYLTVNKID